MPNLTRIGANTKGVFLDVLDKVLPNGWDFGLSSEIYKDLNGNNHESLGIPATIKIAYKRDTKAFLRKAQNDLNNTGDANIERVLEIVTKD